MKKLFSPIAALVALSLLTGCQAGGRFSDFVNSAFVSIKNPVSTDDFYWAKAAYDGVALAVANYRELPLCKKSNPFKLNNICAKRSTLVQLQALDLKAYNALVTADTYIKENQTLNLASAISAAKLAVQAYKDYAASKGLQS